MFEFKIKATKGNARRGEFTTPHGIFETPQFMAVGTVGAVKGIAPWELKALGAGVILGNTYHLMLRPGAATIKKHGGLHGFMKWNGPILTDSGGFQVFSLGDRLTLTNRGGGGVAGIKPAKITEEGVEFYSHLDGSKHFLDAEKSLSIQRDLGADIVMAFDECPAGDAVVTKVKEATERTHRWLKRSVDAWQDRDRQALFGIVQGGSIKALREESAKFINQCDLPGNAIGGVAVGEAKAKFWQAVAWAVPYLDVNKPRYLMGIGEPADMIAAVRRGCDMFDCVLPTRLGRHGQVWVGAAAAGARSIKKETLPNGVEFAYGSIDLAAAAHREDLSVIDKDCACPTCQGGFSRSYLRHLIFEHDPLGIRLTTLHNLHFVYRLMDSIKYSI
jgi:queuine tRNA-ribosyltransferase